MKLEPISVEVLELLDGEFEFYQRNLQFKWDSKLHQLYLWEFEDDNWYELFTSPHKTFKEVLDGYALLYEPLYIVNI